MSGTPTHKSEEDGIQLLSLTSSISPASPLHVADNKSGGDNHTDIKDVDLKDSASEREPIRGEEKSDRPKEWPSVLRDGWNAYIRSSLKEVFLTSKMNLLLFCIPLAFMSRYGDWGAAPTFVFSLLALCPLAERVSFVTEELAKYTNDTLGGLLNASMGNVTELIVSMVALKSGLYRLVQVSLIGSILGNLLLVLGCAFLFGGLKHKTQQFNQMAASANTGLLLLAIMSVLFPAVLSATHQEQSEFSSALALSRFTGLFMLFLYGLLIVYQLKTHSQLFESQDEGGDPEPPVLGFWGAIFWCVLLTMFISFASEFVVDSVEGAAVSLGVPRLFIATILLPIVGNAAEHASAIIFAMKNRMDVSLGIALGSATQIALFVLPLCVVVGWMSGDPLSLDFHIFETSTLFLSVIITCFGMQSGQSDWLKGVLLLVAYVVIGASFWAHQDPRDLSGKETKP